MATDIRNRLTGLRQQVQAAAEELSREIEAHLAAQRESITGSEDWHTLPEADRSELSQRLEFDVLPAARALDGIWTLLNSRIEMDARISQVRKAVEDRLKAIKEQQEINQQPPVVNVPESVTGGDSGKPATVARVRIRRCYSSQDVPALQKTVDELTAGIATLQKDPAAQLTLDMDSQP